MKIDKVVTIYSKFWFTDCGISWSYYFYLIIIKVNDQAWQMRIYRKNFPILYPILSFLLYHNKMKLVSYYYKTKNVVRLKFRWISLIWRCKEWHGYIVKPQTL